MDTQLPEPAEDTPAEDAPAEDAPHERDAAHPAGAPEPAEPSGVSRLRARLSDSVLSDPRMFVYVAVGVVILAGALALWWSASMIAASWWIPAVGVLAVGAAFGLWLKRPRAGATALLALGATVLFASGFALAMGGAVPWLLVAFWAGSALVLGAVLGYVSAERKPDRQDAATVLAVLSLLLLSAIALAQIVRVSWSAAERAELEALPVYGAADVEVEAAPQGAWAAYFPLAASGIEGAEATIIDRLLRDGWSVKRLPAELALRARRDGYVVMFYFEHVSETVPDEDASSGDQALRGVVNVAVELQAEER